MSMSKNRINYMLTDREVSSRSQSWIGQQIGVSQSTISRWSRGLSEVPSQYRNAIRNLYQREVYNNLRLKGASSYQANRFRWYAPNSVLKVEDQLTEKVEYLTTGWLGKTSHQIGGELTAEELQELFDIGTDIIRDALRQSKKPLELIFKYGQKDEE